MGELTWKLLEILPDGSLNLEIYDDGVIFAERHNVSRIDQGAPYVEEIPGTRRREPLYDQAVERVDSRTGEKRIEIPTEEVWETRIVRPVDRPPVNDVTALDKAIQAYVDAYAWGKAQEAQLEVAPEVAERVGR